MQLPPLTRATLLRRYKRFLADVRLADGTEITVHCPNTGAMTGCADAGSPVWLSHSDSKTRKYAYSWELVETAQGLCCIHSARANAVVAEAVAAQQLPGLAGYPELRREVPYDGNSRADIALVDGQRQVLVEVKSVTLCRSDGWGVFPDAVSARASKHVQALAAARNANTRAVLVFCVLHNGINRVAAAADIDPHYRDVLAAGIDAGVEVLACAATVSESGIAVERELPFSLDPV